MADAKWEENKSLADAQAAATTYNSASVTYSSASVYYNGYNPTSYTPEGEAGAVWEEVDE